MPLISYVRRLEMNTLPGIPSGPGVVLRVAILLAAFNSSSSVSFNTRVCLTRRDHSSWVVNFNEIWSNDSKANVI